MIYFIFTLSGYGELLKKKFWDKTLFEYAKKENFNLISQNGIWGHIYLGKTFEKSYFEFFKNKENFPGEGFLRCLENKIEITENQTPFVGKLLNQNEKVVVETDLKISDKEIEQLLFSISKEKFKFFVKDGKIILIFEKKYPYEKVVFPNKLKNRRFDEFLYENKKNQEINEVIFNSFRIFSSHQINKVREELGELTANLLWIWGRGEKMEIEPLSERIERETFYLDLNHKENGIAELLGFEKRETISNKKNSLNWVKLSLDINENLSLWLKKFENFDKEVLKPLVKKEDVKILFIFDCFTDPDIEINNGWAVFLLYPEKKHGIFFRKNFRKSYLLFEKFLAK